MPLPRRGGSARMVGGALVVAGGYVADDSRFSDREGHELTFC